MARGDNQEDERPATLFAAEIARILRREKGMTQEELARLIDYSASAVSLMETGAQPPSDQMLEALERTLGEERGLFEAARKYVLMEKYPVRFRKFSTLEASAHAISSYETLVVDGLFQTEGYARALICGTYPTPSPAKAEELVEARMARKAVFDREPTALIELILEESVLRRPYGSWEIMRGQYESLIEDASRFNVTVQVLPLERGLTGTFAGDRGAMKLVETKDHDHVVYLEIEDESLLISNRAKVSHLSQRYAKIRAQALSPDESLGLLKQLAGERR
ncbi:helix-turn-helix transcriptional regulator [Streptomyces sp. NPDC002054]|uniref:helix-turn-helix domain-containing protein n=1 Tax=Streptomyces sp. NPDC002054 TaxID=3154663 RepID=UPI0033272407